MFSRSLGLCALLVVVLPSLPTVAQAQQPGAGAARVPGAGQAKRPDVSPGEYLVGFRAGVAHNQGVAVVRNLGANVTSQFPEVGAAAIRVAGEAVAHAIARNPQVAYVEPMPMRYPLGLEDSQLAPALDNGLYGLITTHATDAHAHGQTGAAINVGVADMGIDYTHPDIAPSYRGGIDTIWGDNDPIWEYWYDESWGWWVAETHGTHVAGTIVAANNSVGVLGVAYSANLYHARVLDAYGGTAATVMDGVRWLVETANCKIVNLSLGGTWPSTTEQNFYLEMRGRGALIVCSAGNDYADSIAYPAGYDSNIAVGALDVNNAHASFSNTGSALDVSAPGVGVLSSVPPGWGFQECWVQTNQRFAAFPLLGGVERTEGITRPIINCGLGKVGQFPPSAAGNIALMQRGDITFDDKMINAMNAGAVAGIIYNNVAGDFQGTLVNLWYSPPAVCVSDTVGATLVSQAGSTGTVVYRFAAWDWYEGTSMAAPHVTGALALIWSVNPSASGEAVENSLFTTCMDLGTAGYDTTFGRGLVDAYAAVMKAQSAGAPPAPPTGLTATGGHWQVSLSWNSSAGADSYVVQRAISSGGPFQFVGQTATAAFADSPLASGTTFYYMVAAVNSGGVSANSAQAFATTTGAPPPTGSVFQGLGGQESVAYAVSADGSTTVGVNRLYSGPEAFRWTTAGDMQLLGDLAGGAAWSTAYAASSNGSVLVGYGSSASSGNYPEACRWINGGSIQALGDLGGGSFISAAYGVSGDGSIIAGYGTSSQGRQAIRHTTAGGMQGLGDFSGGAFDSIAYGISSDGGTIVGYGTSSQGKQAFRWTAGGGMQGLGDLAGGAFESIAHAVSADGSVIVGSATSASGKKAFRWTSGGGMQALGDLSGGSFQSSALAVSADGSIVVGGGSSALGSAAFVWNASAGMQNLQEVLAYDYGLDLAGWTLAEARGISADGRTIVGSGANPYGYGEAWIATLGSGPPCTTFVAPDLDHDCDVDTADVAAFKACASRAGVPVTPACQSSDFDGDNDADLTDFGILQRCYGNAVPTCVN